MMKNIEKFVPFPFLVSVEFAETHLTGILLKSSGGSIPVFHYYSRCTYFQKRSIKCIYVDPCCEDFTIVVWECPCENWKLWCWKASRLHIWKKITTISCYFLFGDYLIGISCFFLLPNRLGLSLAFVFNYCYLILLSKPRVPAGIQWQMMWMTLQNW